MSQRGYEVRRARIDDARGIAEVHVRSWQAAYRGLIDEAFLAKLSVEKRQAMWEECLKREPPIIFVAEEDSSVIGFCTLGPTRDRAGESASVAEIMALYVQPEYWSMGVGAALWTQVLDRVTADGFDSIVLWVLDTNLRARTFYERIGFEADGGTKSEQLTDGITLIEVRYRRA
jgi:ribosomal protein S18 acetylase RimI-like enzyme